MPADGTCDNTATPLKGSAHQIAHETNETLSIIDRYDSADDQRPAAHETVAPRTLRPMSSLPGQADSSELAPLGRSSGGFHRGLRDPLTPPLLSPKGPRPDPLLPAASTAKDDAAATAFSSDTARQRASTSPASPAAPSPAPPPLPSSTPARPGAGSPPHLSDDTGSSRAPGSLMGQEAATSPSKKYSVKIAEVDNYTDEYLTKAPEPRSPGAALERSVSLLGKRDDSEPPGRLRSPSISDKTNGHSVRDGLGDTAGPASSPAVMRLSHDRRLAGSGVQLAKVEPEEPQTPQQIVADLVSGRLHLTRAFNPKHPWFRRWEVVMMLLIMYTAIVTPYETAFIATGDEETAIDFLFVFNRLVDLCFFVDLIFTFHVAYLDESTGQWIFDLHQVRMKYLKTWFLLDFISVLPFDIAGFVMQSDDISTLKVLKVVRLARLAKLLRILRAARMFRRLESTYNVNYSLLKMTEFFVVTVLVNHWVACMWSMVEVLEDTEVTWLTRAFQEYESSAAVREEVHHLRIYVAALFWSIGHMTIGYGDIIPTNDLERSIAMFLMLFGALLSGYIIGAVASILSARDEKRNRFYKTIKMLNDFMEEGRFPHSLRQKLREYFKYACTSNNIHSYRELLEQMSPALRGQVACQTDNTWIASIPFFQACPEEFLLHVALRFDQITYPPEEMVFPAGRLNTKLYVVKRGVVSYGGLVKTSGKVMCEDCLYKVSVNGYMAKTLTFAIMYILDRKDLLELIDEFPETKIEFRRLSIKAIFRSEVFAYVGAYRRAQFEKDDLAEADYDVFPSGAFRGPKGTASIWDVRFFGRNEREDHYYKKLKMIMVKDPQEQLRIEKACFLIQSHFKGHIRRMRFRHKMGGRSRGLSRVFTKSDIQFEAEEAAEEDDEEAAGVKRRGSLKGNSIGSASHTGGKGSLHRSFTLRGVSFEESQPKNISKSGSFESSKSEGVSFAQQDSGRERRLQRLGSFPSASSLEARSQEDGGGAGSALGEMLLPEEREKKAREVALHAEAWKPFERFMQSMARDMEELKEDMRGMKADLKSQKEGSRRQTAVIAKMERSLGQIAARFAPPDVPAEDAED